MIKLKAMSERLILGHACDFLASPLELSVMAYLKLIGVLVRRQDVALFSLITAASQWHYYKASYLDGDEHNAAPFWVTNSSSVFLGLLHFSRTIFSLQMLITLRSGSASVLAYGIAYLPDHLCSFCIYAPRCCAMLACENVYLPLQNSMGSYPVTSSLLVPHFLAISDEHCQCGKDRMICCLGFASMKTNVIPTHSNFCIRIPWRLFSSSLGSAQRTSCRVLCKKLSFRLHAP